MSTFQLKADKLGAISGSLCLIHCIITPFVFLIQPQSVLGSEHTPIWWHLIDYVFIVISFYAIYQSTRHSTKRWLKTSFWLAWSLLFFAIFNESFEITYHSEAFIYVPAIAIIALHLYNHRYHKCSVDNCSANQLK